MYCTYPAVVMPGLVPGIHVLAAKKGADGRDEPGHDMGRAKCR